MKKQLWSIVLCFLFLLASGAPAFAVQEQDIDPQELSPTYLRHLEWLQRQNAAQKAASVNKGNGGERDGQERADEDAATQPHLKGWEPSPIKRIYRPKTSPSSSDFEEEESLRLDFEKALPTSYDPRTSLPPARSQGPFGTCWAFAGIGAVEANAISQGIADKSIDLSEMYLAWFVRGDGREGKSPAPYKTTVAEDENPASVEAVLLGGRSDYSVAFMSREGAIQEHLLLPYPTTIPHVSVATAFHDVKEAPKHGIPEDYSPPFLQLRDAYFLGNIADDADENTRAQWRQSIKQAIKDHGGVNIGYLDDDYRWWPSQSNKKYYFSKVKYGGSCVQEKSCGGHAVLLVGWNDNFSRMNFGNSEATRPQNNGAWLVRNSWGTWLGEDRDGYFWMSYEQDINEPTVFIVDLADLSLPYQYLWDDLGHLWQTWHSWAANVFQAKKNETVREIAFYTTDDNAQYEAYVYDLGTTKPTSSPVKGTPLARKSGTIANRGYHRVALSTPADIDAGHWFSVVIKMTTPNNSKPTATEERYRVEPVVNAGESWFSSDGASWTDGISACGDPCNATIRAFTSEQSLSIRTTSLPSGNVSVAYSATLEAGGAKPITWAVASGALPPGLSLASNGRISGTPTKGGDFSFTVRASNSTGAVTRALRITISEGQAPVIYTTGLPGGAAVGVPYSATLRVSKGTQPITWSVAAGSLPPGITLASNGQISGTPTSKGVYNITVRASNRFGSAERTMAIKVFYEVPVIRTTGLPGSAAVGKAYSAVLKTSAGTAGKQTVTWSIASGSLPPGVTLSPNGQISGAPTSKGVYNLTVRASNDFGADTRAMVVKVFYEVPVIRTTGLPGSAAVGKAYSAALKTSAGTAGKQTIRWSVASGSLPPGVTLASNGQISGTPTSKGVYNFTVRASNDFGAATRAMAVKVFYEVPVIRTTGLPGGAAVGRAYSAELKVSAGTAGKQTITWTLASGSLPPGVFLSSNGQISGTPIRRGIFTFTVRASNNFGIAERALDIRVLSGPPVIRTTGLPGGVTVGKAYSATISLSEGSKPITWSVDEGELPPGLALSEGGQISGTPTGAGVYTFVVRARNDFGVARRMMSIKVLGRTAPVITNPWKTNWLYDAPVGAFYSVYFRAASLADVSWSHVSGTLPPGMRFDSDGEFWGTPTQAGRYYFVVQATNHVGSTSKTIAIDITEADAATSPEITYPSRRWMSDGSAGTYYSEYLNSSVSNAYWQLASGTLPPGLQLDRDGELRGTPKATGRYSFDVQVINYDDTSKSTGRTVWIDIVESTEPNDFDKLNKSNAITIVRGNGSRKLAVFEDPNCPYCKQLEQNLAAIENVTVHVFVTQVLSSTKQGNFAQRLWCSANKAKTWTDWMLSGTAPGNNTSCNTAALAENRTVFDGHGFTGVPALIFADGSIVKGAINAAAIEEYLARQ